MRRIKNILLNLIIFAALFMPRTTAYASALNPSTGDTAGRFIWIVIGVAAVALLALIIIAVSGRKKK